MEKIDKRGCKQAESTTDLFLRWGNKKRLRCVRVRDRDDTADSSSAVSGRRRIRRKINSHFVTFSSDNDNREPSLPPPSTRLTRHSEAAAMTTLRLESNRKSSSEKEDKLEKPKISVVDGGGGGGVFDEGSKSKHVWPKLYIALTSKEKEEDFMAMKGCKPSHRPKKRAKMIQRTILLVSPGAWLTDMCQERYEVREKKSTKKRPTGLKAMGNMESDSE
ncbi:hypothetical protein L1987_10337 [Smallanthus sonchifolius]|uniref:Uncharacterized protein n=1 Tax=Smallanthus sonchifolius TaxID=185202 RepID=A0ACB9JRX7_9ASTR|nr:hypothetical protein L1987_10337 [Smallanthus sonchifolius]